MANSNQPFQSHADRQREDDLNRITARYVEEFQAGKAPRVADYIQRHPQYADELMEFVLYFHAIAAGLPEPDALPAQQFTPAANAARTRLREQTSSGSAAPLSSLFRQALAVGYPPPQLAQAIGLSWDIVAKLEARAIAAASIPRTLTQRLADTLKVAPTAISAYLQGTTPTQSGAFFYADQPPEQQQETFLAAVQSTPELSQEQKRAWADIVGQELPES
ncbi:MAG TPA: hypothetical protein VH590_00230 [Ktedonobacterales bacterium]|jgi:hypothetical protein